MTEEEMIALKTEEYNKYIEEHIANIATACGIFNLLNPPELNYDTAELLRRCHNHDKSKFSPEEFEAYHRHFHPINEMEKRNSTDAFEKARKHHYLNNDHHWNYWLDEYDNPTEMTDNAIAEMICDWMAMGIKFDNNYKAAYDWYWADKQQKKIKLAPNTKDKVEAVLIRIRTKG